MSVQGSPEWREQLVEAVASALAASALELDDDYDRVAAAVIDALGVEIWQLRFRCPVHGYEWVSDTGFTCIRVDGAVGSACGAVMLAEPVFSISALGVSSPSSTRKTD